eukprot:11108309-Alexandrium_andersonii.AAC.1
MSASLVGSEMCIRDRACAGNVEVLWRLLWGSCENAVEAPWMYCGGTVGAVSYTHLTLPTICSV